MYKFSFQILLAAALCVNAAAARKGIRVGNLELHPYTQLSEYYDSNIYLVPKDQANGVVVGGGVLSSYIHEAKAGLKFKLPVTGMHAFEGNYNAQGRAYETQPSANNTFNHNGELAYKYSGPLGIKAKLWDKYLNTEDPAFSELVQREARWTNTAGFDGEYAPKGGRLFVGASAKHHTHKYISPSLGAQLNRYEQSFGGRFGYRIMPQTRVYVGYARDLTHYTVAGNNRNTKSHRINGGIEGKLLPQLKGRVQGALLLRDYEDQNAANRTGYVRTGGVTVNLAYQPLDRCSVKLALGRALQESTFSNNRFYFHNSASLNLRHKFPFKLTMTAGAAVTVDQYPDSSTLGGLTANRRDDIYSQQVRLDYDIQDWIKVGVRYEHSQRYSIFSGQFNYERHLTSFNLRLMM